MTTTASEEWTSVPTEMRRPAGAHMDPGCTGPVAGGRPRRRIRRWGLRRLGRVAGAFRRVRCCRALPRQARKRRLAGQLAGADVRRPCPRVACRACGLACPSRLQRSTRGAGRVQPGWLGRTARGHRGRRGFRRLGVRPRRHSRCPGPRPDRARAAGQGHRPRQRSPRQCCGSTSAPAGFGRESRSRTFSPTSFGWPTEAGTPARPSTSTICRRSRSSAVSWTSIRFRSSSVSRAPSSRSSAPRTRSSRSGRASRPTPPTCPRLPGDPHGIAVFPGADHGLFTADPDPAVPRTEQLAPGFLPMVAGFLSSQTS